jgi:protein-tyrosine-phosphatase
MAAALATALFAREKLGISVASAGTNAYDGSCASDNAVLAMEFEKLDLKNHKSQAAALELLQNSALVLTMTRSHLSHVKRIFPEANAFTLGEFAGSAADVCDPFGGDLDEYKNCAAQIKDLLEACLEKFKTTIK